MLITNILEGKNEKTYTFSKFIDNVNDLKELNIKNEYEAACAVLFTLATFETNEANAKEMFEYINGPEDMSNFDLNFIKNQLSQYPYVVRSYFKGASVDNNYQPTSPITLAIKENTYSRNEENYIQLLVHSSGADNDRGFKLRKKPSTGEWFMFSDSYKGLLAGIRIPKQLDKWA